MLAKTALVSLIIVSAPPTLNGIPLLAFFFLSSCSLTLLGFFSPPDFFAFSSTASEAFLPNVFAQANLAAEAIPPPAAFAPEAAPAFPLFFIASLISASKSPVEVPPTDAEELIPTAIPGIANARLSSIWSLLWFAVTVSSPPTSMSPDTIECVSPSS